MKKLLFALLLCAGAASSAFGQSTPPTTWQEADGSPKITPPKTVIVPNGSISGRTVTITGGGGSGCTPPGTANRVLYDNGAGGCTSAAGFTFNGTSTISLGVAGTSVGAIGFRNATSGTITLQPVTGALGTVTLSLPAATDTLVGRVTTDILSNKTLASPSVTGNISADATSRLIYGSNEYRYTNTTGPAFYDDTTGSILTFNVQSLAANRTVTFPNSSLTIAGIDVANAWADGVKQTFNPDATNAGINVGSVAGDPSAPANGDLWYDSTANELTARINGANVALGSGGGGGITVGTTTITSGTNTRVLYNNAGVVGEYVITGTGNVMMSASPTTTGTLTADAANFGGAVALTSTTAASNLITQGAAINIGTISTDGIVLQNTTAAAAGAQQYSPRLRLTGQGWKTNATAASQTTDWIVENIPVQGTANPDTGLNFSAQINAGGYSTRIRMLATAGSGATAAGNFNVLNPNGTNAIVTGYGRSFFGSNIVSGGVASSPSIMLDASNTTISIRRSGHIGWSNSSGDASTSQDASFIAASAGVIRCANGGTGACTGLVLGTSTVGSIGTSGVGVLAIANGTAPSSRPADEFQVYAADYAAGDSRANILSESNATPVTIGNHSVLTGYQHLTKTADYTVVTADSNVFFDNAGAGAGVVFTLPTPTASPSLKYTFCRVANQTVTVDIGGSVTIRGGASVTTSGGNVTLDAVGTCLTIYSVSSTEWYASATLGTLTFN